MYETKVPLPSLPLAAKRDGWGGNGEREGEASSFAASTGREETQWEWKEERSTLSLKTCLLDVV